MWEVIVISSHFLLLCLSDVKNNKRYLKELLQINDVIISLPHTKQKKC